VREHHQFYVGALKWTVLDRPDNREIDQFDTARESTCLVCAAVPSLPACDWCRRPRRRCRPRTPAAPPRAATGVTASKGDRMFREHEARALTEKIDDAIEQAEDLGLTFVAGILMMARLETVQTEHLRIVGRENKQLS
jgi:hypothetical protein